MFIYILIASLVGSVCALIGGVVLLWKENLARKASLFLLSFAVGALLGAAFFDLLPEASEELQGEALFLFPLIGIIAAYLFERFLFWHHCHDLENCQRRVMSGTVLLGDAVHNFIDGLVIALSFAISIPVGIAATLAVFFHEVPQEIADFGVLLHAGYSKKKVFFYNLATALTTPVGAILGYFTLPFIHSALPQLAAFAAGLFIYIAIADLLPELHRETRTRGLVHILFMLLGLAALRLVGIL